MDSPEIHLAIEPLRDVRNLMRDQNRLLGYRLERQAQSDELCRCLMTIPGVGPLTSLAYKAAIDDPKRFANAKDVAAHLGLTPHIYQFGGNGPVRFNQQMRGQVAAIFSI